MFPGGAGPAKAGTVVPPFHQVPAHLFRAIARGAGGVEAVALLFGAQYSKNLLLLRALIDHARRGAQADEVRGAVAALREVAGVAEESAVYVLTYPAVSAWLAETVSLLVSGQIRAARPGRIALVAAAAALRARVPVALDLPGAEVTDAVILPGLGRLHLPARPSGGIAVRTCPDGSVTVAGAYGAARWEPVRRLTAVHDGLAFGVCVDSLVEFCGGNRMFVEEPVREQAETWYDCLASAWRILVEDHRPFADEISAAVRMLTPLHTPRRGQRSGTFRHAIGCVAMSRPYDDRSAAVTLVHETQHAKLSALMNLFPLILPGPDVRFPVPWRTDRRPLEGLLQGMYAHLGVAAFWRRQRHRETRPEAALRATVEFARWRTAARDVALVLLGTGRLTELGRLLVTEALQRLDEWCAEPVPPRAAAIATQLADRHSRTVSGTALDLG